jgi:hypothetical protein
MIDLIQSACGYFKAPAAHARGGAAHHGSEGAGVPSIAAVQPLHVATWIEIQTRNEASAPTVKQALAAIRHLFDWLVTGQVVPVNRARAPARGSARKIKGRGRPTRSSAGRSIG